MGSRNLAERGLGTITVYNPLQVLYEAQNKNQRAKDRRAHWRKKHEEKTKNE
jgi:hypothetical protein